MYLSEGKKDSSYTIEAILLDEAAKRRLEVLGMVKGTEITIATRKHNAAMVIKVRGARFAIGSDFAKGIVVSERSGEGK